MAKVDCDLSNPIHTYPNFKSPGVELYARCATKRATLKIEFNIFNNGIVALTRVMQGVWHTGIVVYGKEGLGQSKPAYMPALPCRPFFAVAELPDWLARACIRPFRHAEKISQSQGVISSISIIILPLVPFPITSPLSHCWQKD